MNHQDKALAVAKYAADVFSDSGDSETGFIFATINTRPDSEGGHDIWFFSNMTEGLGTALRLVFNAVEASQAKGSIRTFRAGIGPNVSDVGHGD